MLKRTEKTLRRVQNKRTSSFIYVTEGILVGIVAGLLAVFYRYLLSAAEKFAFWINDLVRGNLSYFCLWLLALAVMGYIVGQITKWEPMAGGSGIPQVT